MTPASGMRLPTAGADGLVPALSALPPANIYTAPEFLEVLGRVYFPGGQCRAEDHVVGRQVFRLLTVDGRPVTDQTFVDFHEALGGVRQLSARDRRGLRRLPRLPRLHNACQGLVEVEAFKADPDAAQAMGAPATLWAGFAAWDDYLALLKSRRFVAEDQRRRRRLEQLHGALEFRADDRAADVLATAFAWKSARDCEAERPDLFAVDENRAFFQQLRAAGLLRASTLRVGGRLLALWLGSVYGGRWSGWVFAFNPDPALSRFSPGRQLLYPMLEESHRAGHREFDFSIGLEPYKLNFATHVRPLGLAGALAPRERLAAAVKGLLGRRPGALDRARALAQALHIR